MSCYMTIIEPAVVKHNGIRSSADIWTQRKTLIVDFRFFVVVVL